MRVPFADPSTYQPLINTTLTALEAATPPLMLAQAQAVKQTLIDALYTMKRTAPITVTVSVGSKTFDGSDEAMATMNEQIALSAAAASTTGLVAQINNLISLLNIDMSTLKTNFNRLSGIDHKRGFGSHMDVEREHRSSDAAAAGGYPAVSGSGVTGGPFPWLPLGATATVNLTLADLTTIVNAAITRRQSVRRHARQQEGGGRRARHDPRRHRL